MKQTVYVSSSESQQIYVWELNEKYTLTLIQVVNVPGKVQPMAISSDKNFLYVGVRPKPRIITYHILNHDGRLSLAQEFPLTGSPTHISTDYDGFFLFSSSYNSNCLSVIRLENGLPIETTDIVKELEGCHSANLSPDNKTLWVSALKKDRFFLFTLSDNGKLSSAMQKELKTANGAGPRHLVFNPKYWYAYAINELHGSVDVWDLNNLNDNIQCIQTVNIMPVNFSGISWAADIHITPNGSHLYTCERASSTLAVLGVYKNGRTLKVEEFQSTEMQPRSFNIDSSGKLLIVSGQRSNHISLYKITGSRGLLKKIGRYPVGRGPAWVEIHMHSLSRNK